MRPPVDRSPQRAAGREGLVRAAAVGAIAAVTAAAAAALFAPQPAAAAGADPVLTITGRMISPWPVFQKADGSFPDYVLEVLPTNSDRVGESTIGASLIRHGMKVNSPKLIASGLKAIDFALRNRDRNEFGKARRLFDDLALAEAWLAVTRRGSRVRVPAATASLWRRELGSVAALSPYQKLGRPQNQLFVEQLTFVELLTSGVRATSSGSVLKDPTALRATVATAVSGLLDRLEGKAESETAVGAAAMVGDLPDFPLAYHSLTLAVASRLATFLGFAPELQARLRAYVAKGITATALTTAPDGDSAYGGRSSQEAWSQTMLIASARQSSVGCGSSCPAAGSPAQVEAMALRRLGAKHLDPKWGVRLVPAMESGLLAVKEAFDPYVTASSYTGLALLGATWAEYTAPAPKAAWSGLQRVAIGGGRGGAGTSSTADSWFAIRSGNLGYDQRYASGLVAAKARVAGNWVDIVVAPPGSSASTGTYGPLAIDGWKVGAMVGPVVKEVDGGLELEGSVTPPSGEAEPMIANVTALFENVPCGVKVSVPTQPAYGVAIALNVPAVELTSPSAGVLEWAAGKVTAQSAEWLEWKRSGPTTVSASTDRVVAGAKAGADGPLVLTVQAKGCVPSG